MAKSAVKTPSLSIKRVKLIYFLLNEHLYKSGPNNKIRFQLGFTMDLSPDEKLIRFVLNTFFNYEGSKEILTEIKVENVFAIADIDGYIKDGFPEHVINLIIGLSISHSRALLAHQLSGSRFQNAMLPIGDAKEVTKHFFAENLKDGKIVIPLEEIGSSEAEQE
jgi:hypothetical protein